MEEIEGLAVKVMGIVKTGHPALVGVNVMVADPATNTLLSAILVKFKTVVEAGMASKMEVRLPCVKVASF